MSEVVAVALITGAGTAIVAIGSVITQVWGPVWREGRARAAERADREVGRRYAAALKFVEAVAQAASPGAGPRDRWAATTARAEFISTLRPGEEGAERFTRRVLDVVLSPAVKVDKARLLDEHVDLLFRWVRGEVTVDDLPDIPVAYEV